MATTYTITNDRYSNDAVQMTQAEIEAYCAEQGWDVTLRTGTTRDGRDCLRDQNGEIVAEVMA